MKDTRAMTASEINRELDKIDKADSQLTDAFIAAGRGHERPSEILKMSDPLALKMRQLFDRRYALKSEIVARTGTDYHRMPTRRRNPGFTAKEEREYKAIVKSGRRRYGRRAKEVAARTVLKGRSVRRGRRTNPPKKYETTLNGVHVKFFQGYAEDVRYIREADGKPYSHVVETNAAEVYLAEHSVYGRCILIVDPSGKTPLWG